MRLKLFEVGGFQSFEAKQQLRLEDDVTLLAGRNNVGKTAIFRAMRLPTYAEEGALADLALRFTWSTTAAECAELMTLHVPVQFRAGIAAFSERITDSVDVRIGARTDAMNYAAVRLPSPISREIGSGLELREIEVANGLKLILRRRLEEGSSSGNAYLWWADGRDYGDAEAALTQALITVIRQSIAMNYYIAPRRSTQRMAFVPTFSLDAGGEALTNVVGGLFTNERHRRFASLEELVRDVFPEVANVEVPMSGNPPAAEIYLRVTQAGRDMTVPLRHSGTGIEQTLMLGAAVLTAPRGSLFLIDEPHAFLHPFAERRLLRFIRDHREHQYVVATHSPVFLTSYPVGHARLVVMSEAGSRVSDVGTHRDILEELEITAADLWSAESVVWVEGASEARVCRVILDTKERPKSAAVREMPSAVRNSARGERLAREAVDFCIAVTEAVMPVDIRTSFIFDSDERPAALRERIQAATGGRAKFLPLRELENLLLSPAAIHADLIDICVDFGRTLPSREAIGADLAAVISSVEDRGLYPVRPEKGDVARVVGSEVLRRLYWKWALMDYDKVRDGERLTRWLLAQEPDRLQPLVDLLDQATAAD